MSVYQIGGAPIRSEGMKLFEVRGRSPRKKFSGVVPFFFGKALLSLMKGNFMVEGPQVKKEIL